MAKLNRESRLRERRQIKEANKQARKQAAAQGLVYPATATAEAEDATAAVEPVLSDL